MFPSTLRTTDENATPFILPTQELSILLEEADRFIKLDAQDESYDVDDVYDDSISGSSDDMEENACETMEFYVGLLMKLVPSLERLRKQSLETKQDSNQSLPLPLVSLSRQSLYDPTENPKSEGLKQLSQNQQASGINKIDPSIRRKFAGKDYMNMSEFGERLEKVLRSELPSSTGIFDYHFPKTLTFLTYED